MISFVVPAYNEERLLGATLQAIHRAARELGIEYEVIVANDGSTDRTAQVAAANGAVVVEAHHRKISATRNSGARAARGDRLVFVDADTQISARLVSAAMAALDAGAVGGGAQVRFPADAPRWVHAGARAVIGFMRLWSWAAGCFIFCRRADFEAVGGFDERHYAAEEIMLSRELKRRGRFVILREEVSTSPRKFETRSAAMTVWLTIRMIARGFRGTRDRRNTDFWYDGKR